MQQQQLQTEQSITNANLNLEENQQRKSILNAMMGTRVFRGSALSRAVVGNTPGTGGEAAAPAPSASQLSPLVVNNEESLIDVRSSGSGSTPAGGTGASGGTPGVVIRGTAVGGKR